MPTLPHCLPVPIGNTGPDTPRHSSDGHTQHTHVRSDLPRWNGSCATDYAKYAYLGSAKRLDQRPSTTKARKQDIASSTLFPRTFSFFSNYYYVLSLARSHSCEPRSQCAASLFAPSAQVPCFTCHIIQQTSSGRFPKQYSHLFSLFPPFLSLFIPFVLNLARDSLTPFSTVSCFLWVPCREVT